MKPVSDAAWTQLAEYIAEKLGLHFPPSRLADLRRGIEGVTKEFKFPDVAACIEWLLRAPLTKSQLQSLAGHLTIGETYFLREKKAFDALTERALPDLIRRRRAGEKRLRLWSAACCTGEEAYSLAITTRQAIPDYRDWHITILATDINEAFLQKAALGVYSEWSFRESPPGFRESCFRPAGNARYEVLDEIKKMVTFAPLNLVEDAYPALVTDTNAMDVIFCRNVLMYFTPAQAAKAVRNLRYALAQDGWLAVSSCEASQTLFAQFAPANFPGAVLYRKTGSPVSIPPWTPPPNFNQPPLPFQMIEAVPSTPIWEPQPATEPIIEESSPDTGALPAVNAALELAESLYRQGRYSETAGTLRASFDKDAPPNPKMFSLLARSLANQGDLSGALECCDQWIAADKLDASGHYLRATVLLERGDSAQSRRSLQRAIYLRSDLALAHFALGNLARADGRHEEAAKHFANAARLLENSQPDDILPESDGLTAVRLAQIISSLAALEPAALNSNP